jgi:EmrB/QacA subfamily drug resistance transporter
MATSVVSGAEQVSLPDPRRWFALWLLAIAEFVVVLDATIINVALPSISHNLHVSTDSLSWVVSAYILAFGGTLLLGGRLADLFGRRRLFVIGLCLFAAASFAGGLSTSLGELIAFRALQGLGAAALAPAARSILAILFVEGAERTKALGLWAAVAGSGSVAGLILGGILTSAFGWRSVLFINVPLALTLAVLAVRRIPESRANVANRSIDWAGATLVTTGVLSMLLALVRANAAGWGSTQTVGLLCLSAVLLTGFVLVESRVAAPLVQLTIFRQPHVRAANVVMTATAAAMVGLFFVMNLYLQEVLGYSAIHAGLSQLPLGLTLIFAAGAAGPLVERIGTKPVLISGLGLFTVGLAWLSRIPVHGSYVPDILLPSLSIGVGLGLIFVAITSESVAGVHPDQTGLAGGLINATQQIGGAIGLAVITAVATSYTTGTTHTPTHIVNGFQTAMLVAAGMAAAGMALAAIVVPAREHMTPSTQAATDTPAHTRA